MSARHPRGGPDRWLLSYADMVTLLLAFFATLYAASSVDARRLSANDATTAGGGRTAMEKLRDELDEQLADAIDAHRVDVVDDIRGLVVSLPQDAAFPAGSNAVAASALTIVDLVAEVVKDAPNPIRIEGHTDDLPIQTAKYGSNWELSTARASAVVAYLVTGRGIDPARLSAAGYGEFHPVVPNDSAANRARNRRIDIVILENSQPPSGQPPSSSAVVELGVGSSR